MAWRTILQDVLLRIILLVHVAATVFGLTTFHYSKRHKSFVDSGFLNRYCKFMGLSFFVMYPFSFLSFVVDIQTGGVTELAKNSVFVGSWLLCTLIFANQTSYASETCELYNRAAALYADITNNQDNDNFKLRLSTKCVFKTCSLALGFLAVNICKFRRFAVERRLSLLQCVLFLYLFVPSFVMILASNRFYVATTFCLYLMMRINNSIGAAGEGYKGLKELRSISIFSRRALKMTSARINALAMSHAALHQLFVDFHAIYANKIVLILGFFFTNFVFEVGNHVDVNEANTNTSCWLMISYNVSLSFF
jgi:7tm Chemosensory receptor